MKALKLTLLMTFACAVILDEDGANPTFRTVVYTNLLPGYTFAVRFRNAWLVSTNAPEAVPLDTTLSKQHDMLESAKEYVHGISDFIKECVTFFHKVAPLALYYAIGGERYVCNMKGKDLKNILQLVVLSDHYGKFGGKLVPWDMFLEHVAPLFQNSAKEKVLFLRDWCSRIRFSGLGKIKTIETIRLVMTPRNQQEMLEAAKVYVENFTQETAATYTLFSEASALIVNYALSDGEQIHNMTFSDLQTILRFVVLTDHFGMFGGYELDCKKFREHVLPLFQTPREMLVFLLDLCSRVCPRELKMRYRAIKEEQQKKLLSAKRFVHYRISRVFACEILYRQASALAVKYAVGGEKQIRKMSAMEHQKILRLVVLTDHYGRYGGEGLGWEEFILHVEPLLRGNPQEKWIFLLDLCERVCPSALRKAQEVNVLQ